MSKYDTIKDPAERIVAIIEDHLNTLPPKERLARMKSANEFMKQANARGSAGSRTKP
jgi:hypothetical protein